MKINSHCQNNNISFGVKMCLRNTKVLNLKKHIRENPPRKLVVCQKIHMLIADHIEKTRDELSLSSCFNMLKERLITKRQNLNFIDALIKSGKTFERAFYETCDKLFDVQLNKNKGEEGQNVDNIFNKKRRIRMNLADRKKVISYCIEHCTPDEKTPNGGKNSINVYNHLKNNEGINYSYHTIENYIYAIFKIPKYYKAFISETTGKKTFKKFHEYITKEDKPSIYKVVYNKFELFKYAKDLFNKKFPQKALIFDEE